MRVEDVMTTPVVAVREDTPIAEAAVLLATHGFTALPVLDRTFKIVGIVTEADIIRAGYAAGPQPTKPSDDGAREPAPHTVGEVMQREALTVTADLDIAEAVEAMLRARVRSVPVLFERHLVGILTRRDLIRALTSAGRRNDGARRWLLALATLPPVPPVQVRRTQGTR